MTINVLLCSVLLTLIVTAAIIIINGENDMHARAIFHPFMSATMCAPNHMEVQCMKTETSLPIAADMASILLKV